MIPEAKLKISLRELSLRGRKILAQQSATSFAQALQQAQRIRMISKVNPLSKKSRVKVLEAYADQHQL